MGERLDQFVCAGCGDEYAVNKPRLVWTSLSCRWYVLRDGKTVTTFSSIRLASRHWWFVERSE